MTRQRQTFTSEFKLHLVKLYQHGYMHCFAHFPDKFCFFLLRVYVAVLLDFFLLTIVADVFAQAFFVLLNERV